MKILKKITQILLVNLILIGWCAGILSLGSAWRNSNPEPGAILAVVISIAIAWFYITETEG